MVDGVGTDHERGDIREFHGVTDGLGEVFRLHLRPRIGTAAVAKAAANAAEYFHTGDAHIVSLRHG